MEQKAGNGNYFDSTSLFEFFWRWRKQLIIIGVAAAVLSAVVSFMIHEKFKSTVIMFPVQSNSVSKALLTEDVTGKQDILQFGEEEQAEQMLQILSSDEIRSRIAQTTWNGIRRWISRSKSASLSVNTVTSTLAGSTDQSAIDSAQF